MTAGDITINVSKCMERYVHRNINQVKSSQVERACKVDLVSQCILALFLSNVNKSVSKVFFVVVFFNLYSTDKVIV